MNEAHIHLLLNHFPIIGTMIGALILLFAVLKKNASIQQVSLVVIVIMAVITLPVYLTGESAAEAVMDLPGVGEDMLEEHEKAAQFAMWFMMITGACALSSLIMLTTQHKGSHMMVRVTLFFSLFTSTVTARTGYLGGQIRHSEIRTEEKADKKQEKQEKQEKEEKEEKQEKGD